MPRNEQKFSLKDHLFNKVKVKKISNEIEAVYPDFMAGSFEKQVLQKFPELELMERVYWIRDCLREYLPSEYRAAVAILLESLPPPSDPTLSDDDFGDYIYAPYGHFVAAYGLDTKDLAFSLAALRSLTTRFSVEAPIRFFINAHPRQTLTELQRWATDTHYHVRRAASEGTRPTLPWAKKITVPITDVVPILDLLYADKTRYVTRSVANHINDISKIDPELAISLLTAWRKEGRQTENEMAYIVRHSLRTLVKQGNAAALSMLGFDPPKISVAPLVIHTPVVQVGEALEFSCHVHSGAAHEQALLVDYNLYFKKANGELAPKTHKIKTLTLKAGDSVVISKKHPLRLMTTRKLYPGEHLVEIQINGRRFPSASFMVG